jgi:hypothetical protein
MNRVYTLNMENVTVANNADSPWCFVNPGVTLSLEALRAEISQRANTTSAQCAFGVGTKVTAFPTLTSTTPRAMHLSDPASAITGGTTGAAGLSGTNASASGGGATTYKKNTNCNALYGYLWLPTPRSTMIVNASASSGMGIIIAAAPATLTNWCAEFEFGELG